MFVSHTWGWKRYRVSEVHDAAVPFAMSFQGHLETGREPTLWWPLEPCETEVGERIFLRTTPTMVFWLIDIFSPQMDGAVNSPQNSSVSRVFLGQSWFWDYEPQFWDGPLYRDLFRCLTGWILIIDLCPKPIQGSNWVYRCMQHLYYRMRWGNLFVDLCITAEFKHLLREPICGSMYYGRILTSICVCPPVG